MLFDCVCCVFFDCLLVCVLLLLFIACEVLVCFFVTYMIVSNLLLVTLRITTTMTKSCLPKQQERIRHNMLVAICLPKPQARNRPYNNNDQILFTKTTSEKFVVVVVRFLYIVILTFVCLFVCLFD